MELCHPECAAGLGGYQVCVHDLDLCDVGNEADANLGVKPHQDGSHGCPQTLDSCSAPTLPRLVNTKASVDLTVITAKEILKLELTNPHPHQVGSTPGWASPPSPCNSQCFRDEISEGE